jgi:hypothetical protein
MGTLGFSVTEVGRGERERTVDVSPGTRRAQLAFGCCVGSGNMKNMNARGNELCEGQDREYPGCKSNKHEKMNGKHLG